MTVIKILPPPLGPLGRVKGQILKFRNNSVGYNIFIEISHADRGTIDIERGYCLWPWYGPLAGHRGGTESNISTFLEYGHVAYQIEGKDAYINIMTNS